MPPGCHLLQILLTDAGGDREDAEPRRWRLRREVEIRPGQGLLVELAEDAGLTVR